MHPPEEPHQHLEDESRFTWSRRRLARSLPRDIKDERVRRAIATVPRERFVPLEVRHLAYADKPLAIGHGQTISQPRMVALMLQELALKGDERVLDVGTGSGYQAALLSLLAREVVTVEIIPSLLERARRTLAELGYANVSAHLAADALGYPPGAPYDAIVVAAAAPRVPRALLDQLAPEGRLVIPVGKREGQDLMVVDRGPEGYSVRRSIPCRFVPLIGRDAYRNSDDEATR